MSGGGLYLRVLSLKGKYTWYERELLKYPIRTKCDACVTEVKLWIIKNMVQTGEN